MTRRTKLYASLTLVFLLAALATTAACSLSDIRPDSFVQKGITPSATKKGRALLEQLAINHGTHQRWRETHVAQAVITDQWFSAATAALASPWPTQHQQFLHTMLVGKDASRLELLNGSEKGHIIGIQNWATYHHDEAGSPVFEENSNTRFWLPTIQYFMEAPFRLREATVVNWIGQEELQGRSYDKVFLSWGSESPQDHVDQYIAWIDRETGLLGFLHYTVRDIAPFITGTMAYKGYRDVQGFQMPTQLRVVTKPGGEDNLHAMSISEIRFHVDLPASFLIPEPEVHRLKHP